MKHILALIAFSLTILISACNTNGSAGKKPDVIKRDSATVLALYKSAMKNEIKFDLMTRIIIDTFNYVDIDTVTKQKQWIKDTTYIIGYLLPVDSALARQYHVPLKDSTGKQNTINLLAPTNKRFVRSGWNGVDSVLIKQLMSQQ